MVEVSADVLLAQLFDKGLVGEDAFLGLFLESAEDEFNIMLLAFAKEVVKHIES